jgi:CheY-like chemotaxis protein
VPEAVSNLPFQLKILQMKSKLNCILLVDDDNDCNFFHKRLLQEMNCTEKIQVATNGAEALEFLKTCSGDYVPDIILLDINMPKVNGWEFLEAYEKLPIQFKAKIVLIMLTTSLNPDDRVKASTFPSVKGFKEKYLDEGMLQDILKEHFADHF